MDDVFANRDEPIPVLAVSGNGLESSDEGRRDALKKSLSGTRLKETFQGKAGGAQKGEDGTHSLSDRLFEKSVAHP
jgi:hypothetical protein